MRLPRRAILIFLLPLLAAQLWCTCAYGFRASSSSRRRTHRPSNTALSFSTPPNNKFNLLSGLQTNDDDDDQATTTAGPISQTFFDELCAHQGEHCLLPQNLEQSALSDAARQRDFWLTFDGFVRLIPIVNPIVAFYSYEDLARTVDVLTEFLSPTQNSWVPVDGGAYQARIIAPAINGVVVPAIAILFATLISNTVSILRQRLMEIRTSINLEAGDLRYLQTMIDSFPDGSVDQMKCRSYLIQYVSRVIAESQPGVTISRLEPTGMDSEMNGMLAQLNEALDRIPPTVAGESYGAIARLNNHRSKRISALQSTFPPLHYIIVSALALSICVAFLMETNQELLIFLNSIQLRILWTMLIGTFSALGVVCYDLRDVFGGSNQVAKSVDQLFTIRSAVVASATATKPASTNGEKKAPSINGHHDDDDAMFAENGKRDKAATAVNGEHRQDTKPAFKRKLKVKGKREKA
jgi:hypothetical protein